MTKPVAQTVESAQIFSSKVFFCTDWTVCATPEQSAPRQNSLRHVAGLYFTGSEKRGWRQNRFCSLKVYVRGSKVVTQ